MRNIVSELVHIVIERTNNIYRSYRLCEKVTRTYSCGMCAKVTGAQGFTSRGVMNPQGTCVYLRMLLVGYRTYTVKISFAREEPCIYVNY